MGIVRRTAAVLFTVLLLFSGCSRDVLPGILPEQTENTEQQQAYRLTKRRYFFAEIPCTPAAIVL